MNALVDAVCDLVILSANWLSSANWFVSETSTKRFSQQASRAHLFIRDVTVVVNVAEVLVVVVQVVGRMLVVHVLRVRDGVVVLETPDLDAARLDGDHQRRVRRQQHTAGMLQAPPRTHRLHRATAHIIRQHTRSCQPTSGRGY